MFIAKTKNLSVVPDVFASGERLQVVSEYKYLGVLIDSKLSFMAQVKKVYNRVRFSLSNFRFICDYIYIYIYIYAFSRRFYPKRLTIAFRLYIMCSLGIEPTTFCAADAMLYH